MGLRRAGWCLLAGLLSSFGLQGGDALAAKLPGAIFTTTPDGGIVNENVHYQSKLEVYLDGGPGPNAPQHAAGLPDGLYVFQVTNPSGWVLLSEDPAKCRVVEVQDSVIIRIVPPGELGFSDSYSVGNGPNGDLLPCHVQDEPDGVAGASGHHDSNTDQDHGPPAIVVQLMPYFDTPNPGGVYKAWMMPLFRYEANGGDLDAMPQDKKYRGTKLGYKPDPGFGPPRDQSKTDNFKVRQAPPALKVRKFHDLDGDGQWDADEPEIGVDECVDLDGNLCACDACGGWPVTITEWPDEGGEFEMDRFTPVCEEVAIGLVQVTEGLFAGWAVSSLALDGVPHEPSTDLLFAAASYAEQHEVVFGNYREASVCGRKFEDLDADGTWEAGEPGLAGVTIHLSGTDGMGNPVATQTSTGADGSFCFSGLAPGTYSVREDVPAGYVPSTAVSSGPHTLASGDRLQLGWVFGNFLPVDIEAHKFYDRNTNGVPDPGEEDLEGIEFCLYETASMALVSCQTTDSDGMVYWLDLMPGSYTVEETLPAGYFATTPVSVAVILQSGGNASLEFGNVADCDGLTPGYWKNWRNHYSAAEFTTLLAGTIAADIAEADAIFADYDASPDDEITILRAFVLANQLTLNLTQHPELPNPSDGSLFSVCQVAGAPGDLAYWLALGVAIDAADGSGYARDEILWVKTVLDWFANLKTDLPL